MHKLNSIAKNAAWYLILLWIVIVSAAATSGLIAFKLFGQDRPDLGLSLAMVVFFYYAVFNRKPKQEK